MLKKYKEIILLVGGSLLVFALTSTLLARYTQIIEVLWRRLARIEISAQELPARRENILATPQAAPLFEDRSTSIRLNVEWPRAVRALAKNPLLGTGYSSITLATDNDFLRLLGEIGILGFSAFALILFNLGKVVKKGLRLMQRLNPLEKGFCIAYTSALVGILLNAFFIDIFEASKFAIIFWLWTGLFVSFVRNYKYE